MLKEIAEDREKKKISGHQSDSVSTTEPKDLTPSASAGARPKMSSDSCQLQVRNQ